MLQAESHYCVPACTCIVARAHGRNLDQRELAGRWSGSARGFALREAAPELAGQHLLLDPTAPTIVRVLGEYLADGALVIALVFSAVIHRIAQKRVPPPASPHGRLCIGQFGWLHAVVLVGYDDSGFSYLDPYFEPAGQPFVMSRPELVEALQGEVVVV